MKRNKKNRIGRFGVLCALSMAMVDSSIADSFRQKVQLQLVAHKKSNPHALIDSWQALIANGRRLSEAEMITRTNNFFNQNILQKSDQEVWQQADYWASPLEMLRVGAGDCEDLAIAKYLTLVRMGVDVQRLRIAYVRAKTDWSASNAHMVLTYYPQEALEPWILDSMVPGVHPISVRKDLQVVYSFNDHALWLGDSANAQPNPELRLSRWKDLQERMRLESL